MSNLSHVFIDWQMVRLPRYHICILYIFVYCTTQTQFLRMPLLIVDQHNGLSCKTVLRLSTRYKAYVRDYSNRIRCIEIHSLKIALTQIHSPTYRKQYTPPHTHTHIQASRSSKLEKLITKRSRTHANNVDRVSHQSTSNYVRK